jgi:hypothetical protein
MEVQMKLGIPAILIAALVVASPVASPAAFAQNMGYTGTTSKPGAGFDKDDANLTKQSKKHMASHKKKHSAKHMTSKAADDGVGQRINWCRRQQGRNYAQVAISFRWSL